MPAEFDVSRALRGKRRSRSIARGNAGWSASPDAAIAAIAARQYGIVARYQLLAAGLTPDAIDRRIAIGLTHPIHRGVYVVGNPTPSTEGRWLAGTLLGGPGTVLSHRAGLALWDLPGGRTDRPEITCPAPIRSRRGLVVHSSSLLPADETTRYRGIPVTTVARTLFDVAGVLSFERFAHAVDIAERRMLGDAVSLRELMDRYPGRRGIRAIRRLYDERRVGLHVTKQELELRFAEFVVRHALPRPDVNALLDAGGLAREVDCLWRAERLIVELDSRRHHDNAAAFESDRERDQALVGAGYRVMRVTWRHLHDRPEALAGDIRRALHANRLRH
jgi:Protein of unknown function (DUF559)